MSEVWIISNTDENSYNNKQIKSEFEKRNIICRVFAIDLLTLFGEIFYYRNNLLNNVEKLSSKPDLVIFTNSINTYGNIPIQKKLVLDKLIAMKPQTIFVNDIESHITASLKHNVYEVLQEAGIPMPKTKVSYDWDASDNFIEQILGEFSLPLVVKSIDGYSGSGTDLCKNRNELKTNLETRLTEIIETKKPIIFQEYAIDSEGLMLKVRLVGNKVEAVYRMYSPYTEEIFKAEIEIGHMCIAANVDQKLYDLVRSIGNNLNIELAWLDFFVSNSEYLFCEINVPGGLFNSIFNNTDFAVEIVEHCLSKLGK